MKEYKTLVEDKKVRYTDKVYANQPVSINGNHIYLDQILSHLYNLTLEYLVKYKTKNYKEQLMLTAKAFDLNIINEAYLYYYPNIGGRSYSSSYAFSTYVPPADHYNFFMILGYDSIAKDFSTDIPNHTDVPLYNPIFLDMFYGMELPF